MKSILTIAKTRLLSKLILVMKLTTFFMLVLAMHVYARGDGQDKLTFAFKKTEIAVILGYIEKQTNYRFLYNDQLNDLRRKITLSVEDASIQQALDLVFQKTPLTYLFMENNLIVVKEDDEKLQMQKNITGKITDENGVPLAGVSIHVKGTFRGTVTNDKGEFTINIDDNEILVFSYIGYDAQEIKVGNNTSINISLITVKKDLENVVVIGYGQVKKRDLTGAVISVKGDEVKKVPAGNIMESVQGKLSGVDIARTSGGAGAKPMITVRGNRSINANNDPLFIVDGVQYNSYEDINANDVESMEILKDASSTAIYGSRGANGVIIITTKKGNSGRVKISANSYYGVSEVAGYPLPMSGPEFADLKREAYRTTGQWNSSADDAKIFNADLTAVNNNVSTYWPGLLLNRGSQQDYGISVASGSDKTRVYFSFDYFKEKGLLKNDYSGRYTVRLNVDQSIGNSLKVGLLNQFTYYDQNLRTDNILTVANKVIPYYTPYNTDGTLAKYPGGGNQVNPLMEEQPGAYVNKNNINRILSSAYAEWKPFKNFSIRSNLGATHSSTRNGSFQGENTIVRALSTGSISSVTNSTGTNLLWENIINWQKKFGDHNLGLTAITSYLSDKLDSSTASGTGQLLPSQSFYALQNNPSNLSIYSRYIASNLISGAFRVNYNYKGKYLLTLTGREDGASVLSTGKQWAFFPSAAAAWRISDETFMSDQKLFNDLKLRISYGVAGNSAVRPYQTESNLILVPFQWNDQSALAYALQPQIGNQDLKWELTSTGDIGVDFSIIKSRISGSFDYYDSRTKDLLLLRQLPVTSGVLSILQNIGKTRNNGFEVSLRTENIQSKNFNWTSNITYTRNKERIVELVGKQNDILNSWFVGYPVNSFYDFEKTGIWQIADSALARSFGYKPGDIRVKDISGPAGKPDGTITAANDRVVVGSAVPKYSLGFSNDISFKRFDLNVYVFARVGQTFISAYANKFEPNAIENGAKVNYWTPENATNEYPRPTSSLSRAALPFATTLGYKDGSFLKIRNISLGYNFPESLVRRLHVANLRWYVSAKNYFTFSKVKDYDPEGAGSFERPLTRLLVTGVNIGF
ncbi:MAG TPA: TonB-dependent receptor [Chitinophagaceae bacterium]|jgi:TonB-linked SusC/RagA family outer membrane protein|nr:TonB-dependent receptor [Chitinophagaceae bacterium]